MDFDRTREYCELLITVPAAAYSLNSFTVRRASPALEVHELPGGPGGSGSPRGPARPAAPLATARALGAAAGSWPGALRLLSLCFRQLGRSMLRNSRRLTRDRPPLSRWEFQWKPLHANKHQIASGQSLHFQHGRRSGGP